MKNIFFFSIFVLLTLMIQTNCGIFDDYEQQARDILSKMNTTQKIGALFMVKYPEKIELEADGTYPSGFLLSSDFMKKSLEDLDKIFDELQEGKEIKFALAVEEEGGEYTPVSKHHRKEPYKSPMQTLFEGGKTALVEEEEDKIHFLKGIHINMNIAPVADVCSNKESFIFKRTLGLDADSTSDYIKDAIHEYVEHKFTSCIKHFPGYGDNKEIITGDEPDERDEELTNEYLKPFQKAIDEGIPMLLMSNLVIEKYDTVPVSISEKWSQRIFNNMKFTGLLLADLNAAENFYKAAIKNGYELLLTTDFKASVDLVKQLLESGDITEEQIEKTVLRILEWKLAYVKHEEEPEEEENNYTAVVLISGIISFVLFGVIAFVLYKLVLSKVDVSKTGEIKADEDHHEEDHHHEEHKEENVKPEEEKLISGNEGKEEAKTN